MNLFYISYKKLSLIILLSFFTLMCASLYYSSVRFALEYTPAMFAFSNTIRSYRTISIDTDGNGKKDMLEIGINDVKNEYSMEIKNDDGSKHIIVPGKEETHAWKYYPSWPLQVTISDINGDKIPEIIAQVPKNENEAGIAIFRWDGKEYSRILSGSWTGISLLDINGDGIPEIITSEGSYGNGYTFHVYSWKGSSYDRTEDRISQADYGYDRINAINTAIGLKYDEKNFNHDFLSSCFTDSAIKNEKSIDALKGIMKDGIIQMQDFISQEIQGRKKTDPHMSLWKIRYVAYKAAGSQYDIKNYVAEVEMVHVGKSYKINKITIKSDPPLL